MEVEEMEM